MPRPSSRARSSRRVGTVTGVGSGSWSNGKQITEHGWTDVHAGSIQDTATVTFTLASGRTISASVKYIAALLLDRLNELDGVA